VLGHDWATRDQARASEKHGIGVIKAKFPRGDGDQNAAAIDRFTTDLTQMPTEGVVPLEQRGGPDGPEPGFDIEPFEFNGSGFAAISDTLNTNAVALAILLLGHNLTTEIKGGGSYAAAGVGEYIRDDIKHDDAAAEWACFGPQLVRPYCLINYGDPELAPRARYIVDSTAQNRAVAQMFQAIAGAIQTLRTNVPRFDVDAFCEQWRIPLLPKGRRAGARRASVAGERQRHGRRQQHHRRRRR
jgi:phage gp29-like protein